MLFISLQWKTEIAETLASSAPSCLGEKGGSDSSQERESQVKAGLSLHWALDARVWQDLGSSEMGFCAQGSAAELRATVPSSPFPCRAVLLNTLQFSPKPLLAVLLSRRGARGKHPRELSRWCLVCPWCLVSGKAGSCQPSPAAVEGPILQPCMRKCPVAQLPSIRLFALFSRSAELHVGK